MNDIERQVIKRIKKQEDLYKTTEMQNKIKDSREDRLYYSNGCIGVSSLKAMDREGFETGILLEDSEKVVVVEAYNDRESMKIGHKFWVDMLESNKLKNIYDLQNVIKLDFSTFRTYLPHNYTDIVKYNKEPRL